MLRITYEKLLKKKFHGGNSYFRAFKKPLWEVYRAIIVRTKFLKKFNLNILNFVFKFTKNQDMFTEAPFISLLIFGLPCGIISIVFYFICCMDTSDTSNGEDDQSDTDAEDCDGEENDELLQEENIKSDISAQGKRI